MNEIKIDRKSKILGEGVEELRKSTRRACIGAELPNRDLPYAKQGC
jgi:hypothetical protein